MSTNVTVPPTALAMTAISRVASVGSADESLQPDGHGTQHVERQFHVFAKMLEKRSRRDRQQQGIAGGLGSYIEYFGLYPTGDGTAENFLDGGFTYLFGSNFQVDARFGVQLEGEGPRYFTGVGLAARL